MSENNRVEEILIKFGQCAGYPNRCGDCPHPDRCKERISQVKHVLCEAVLDSLPYMRLSLAKDCRSAIQKLFGVEEKEMKEK